MRSDIKAMQHLFMAVLYKIRKKDNTKIQQHTNSIIQNYNKNYIKHIKFNGV